MRYLPPWYEMSGAQASGTDEYVDHQLGRVEKASAPALNAIRLVDDLLEIPPPVAYSRYWPEEVRIIVGSWTTVDPVTVPGFGYALAVPGTRASRTAAGTARRAVLRDERDERGPRDVREVRDVRLTRNLLGRMGSSSGISNGGRSVGRLRAPQRRVEALPRQRFSHT
ncbi:hypothetical protein GCM10010365_34180 [Streptomyces poonensis]|uniref:Uncharacterized protein n=1 Tax=Streptomyces poonensis TaxID=68255 RepID=A0A918UHB4_9ACTN|nr:hypothetical protein GCM10010365_34180 [Streptomyces poonensis]GLJ92667.1 hypothetical protein GCM10017589_52770 [Streptomyces poonensis]